MQSVTLITLLAFVAQAHANKVATNDLDDSQVDQVLSKLATKLIDRVLGASPIRSEDLDTTTLGKPAHNLGVPAQADPLASSSPDQEEVIIVEEQPEDGDALDYVLGLRGGKAMKAMAMKAAMKASASPMKATKKAPAMKAPAMKAAMKKR